MRFRAAYRIVQPIHMANATRNNARRSPPPESAGSWASLSAMPAWNGFVGPKALPIIAAPALIATTTTPSTPRPRPSTRSTGTSGMVSSCMFSSAPIVAKNTQTTGIAHKPRCLNLRTSAATTAGRVPRRSTTTQAPPTKSTTAITSAAATKPRGTTTAAANGPTGASATRW